MIRRCQILPLALALVCGLIHAEDVRRQPLLPPLPPLPPAVREISLDDAEAILRTQKDFQILDVRTVEEYRGIGHIPGARHLDYFHFSTDLPKQLIDVVSLDASKPILVYCALGGRSRSAAMEMAKAGCKEILWLKDGFDAWMAEKKPVEKEK